MRAITCKKKKRNLKEWTYRVFQAASLLTSHWLPGRMWRQRCGGIRRKEATMFNRSFTKAWQEVLCASRFAHWFLCTVSVRIDSSHIWSLIMVSTSQGPFLPSLLLLPSILLLPANLLPHNFCCLGDIWYPDIWINLPPPFPLLASSPFSPSHLTCLHLCSLLQFTQSSRCTAIRRSMRALTQLSRWEVGDASWSNACDSQSQFALLTSGSDSGGGFIPCSLNRVLSFLDEKHPMRYKRHHREGAGSNSAKCQYHLSFGSFWSTELAFVLETCRAKGQTCRCKRQIWWTLWQRWRISTWRDWWDELGAWKSVGKREKIILIAKRRD